MLPNSELAAPSGGAPATLRIAVLISLRYAAYDKKGADKKGSPLENYAVFHR
jgi:hypothetical protein